jgi:hypothetical protein
MAGLNVDFLQPVDFGDDSLSNSENGKVENLKLIRCVRRSEDGNTVLVLAKPSKSGSIIRGAISEDQKRRPVVAVGCSSSMDFRSEG